MSKIDAKAAELEALLKTDHGEKEISAVRAFFAGMPEKQRRELAPVAARCHKAARSTPWDAEPVFPSSYTTSYAVAATATFAELQQPGWWAPDEDFLAVLLDRKPPWLGDATELLLERVTSSWMVGQVVRKILVWVAEKKIKPPQHDHFAIGVPYSLFDDAREQSLIDAVRQKLPLIEVAIWRQFEVEGGGEISLMQFDKYMAPKVGGNWADALCVMANEGRLDRVRLLAASLDALNRGFAEFRSGWFLRFHAQLDPTLTERETLTERYLDLLSSPIGPTVSMSVAAVKQLYKAGSLKPAVLVARIEPALYAKATSTAKTAIAMLGDAAKTSPKLAANALQQVAIGLEHPKPDVQTEALTLLEQHRKSLSADTREAIAARATVVAPSLQTRLEALTGEAGTAAPSPPPTAEFDADDLRRRAADLPAKLRALAGIDAAVAALETGALAPRCRFDGMDIPRLDAAITPIATFEELIDEALVAIEHPNDLDRVERVLAGVLRFSAERPDNVTEVLAPLEKSLQRFRKRPHQSEEWLSPHGAVRSALSALSGHAAPSINLAPGNPRAVMVLRLADMCRMINARLPCIALCTPTHRGHWIDPVELVARSKASASTGQPHRLGRADQILALLRLAPDNRAKALKAAKTIPAEWGDALRYALGGPLVIGTTPALWVAAARARAPFDDAPDISSLDGADARGAAERVFYALRVHSRKSGSYTFTDICLASSPDQAGVPFGWPTTSGRERKLDNIEASHCMPTVALASAKHLYELRAYRRDFHSLSDTWATALWPQHPEPVFALAVVAECMADGNDLDAPGRVPLADGLTMILDPDVPLCGPMATMMLCRGLNALDAATVQATIDALIALIADGRLDGDTLGASLHEFLMLGLLFGKRWPERIRQAAQASRLTARILHRAFERAVYPGRPQRPPRDIHCWFALMLDLCAETQTPITDAEARAGIAALGKSGKAKSSARQLLDFTCERNQAADTASAADALEQRLQRAERWHRRQRRSS